MKDYSDILFIDNDSFNLSLIEVILGELNPKIKFDKLYTTTSGIEGSMHLTRFLEKNYSLPNLIFINLNIHDSDGFSIIERVVETDVYRKEKTKIIPLLDANPFLMGNAGSEILNHLKHLNIQNYLVLPLTPEKVIHILND